MRELGDRLRIAGYYFWEFTDLLFELPLEIFIFAPLEFVLGGAVEVFFHPLGTMRELWYQLRALAMRTYLYLLTPIIFLHYCTQLAKAQPSALWLSPFYFLLAHARRSREGPLYWLYAPSELVLNWGILYLMIMAARWIILLSVMVIWDGPTKGSAGEIWMCHLTAWCPGQIGAAWGELVQRIYAIPYDVVLVVSCFVLISGLLTLVSGLLLCDV
jgi:hypothetical protein